MPIPATSGQFRTNLQDMQIGDYIAFKAVGASGAAPVISEIGAELDTAQANEIPVAGTATPNGYAYAIKVDNGLCIADRVVQHSVSWDVLNAAKLIQGKVVPQYYKNFLTGNNMDGELASASSEYSSTYAAWRAFNGTNNDTTDVWASGNGLITGELIRQFLTPKKFMCYSLTSRVDGAGSEPKEWNLLGSKDGGQTYILLDNVKNQINWDRNETRIFMIPKTSIENYNAYKLQVLSINGGTFIVIAELRFGYGIGIIRSLTGGNSYLGADGKLSLTDQNLGAFPANNEWDRYIVNSNLGGKIIAGDDNVWHWSSGISTMCRNTPINGLYTINLVTGDSATRIHRGKYIYSGTNYGLNINTVNSSISHAGYVTGLGFRPVFQFLESNSKATNLFY